MTKEIRKSGIIYNGMYQQIKEIEKSDPKMAGELAISYFEQILTGEIQSKNPIITACIAGMTPIIENNVRKWDDRKEQADEKRIENLKLREIAAMLNQGLTQEQIGNRLGVSKSAISKRITTMKKDFAYLMESPEPETANQESDDEIKSWETIDENGEKHFNF